MMMRRRQFLSVAGAALGLAPIVAWFARPSAERRPASEKRFPVTKSEDEWRRELTPEAYHVLREHGTERAGSSPLNYEKRDGTFHCAACDQALFDSDTKYESGTGWPSFWKPLDNAVGTSVDRSYFMVRIEVHCARCGSHLGHVFDDGPRPTGLRYCMNGVALAFRPRSLNSQLPTSNSQVRPEAGILEIGSWKLGVGS